MFTNFAATNLSLHVLASSVGFIRLWGFGFRGSGFYDEGLASSTLGQQLARALKIEVVLAQTPIVGTP